VLVVTFACWIGDAGAQNGVGKVGAAPAGPLKKAVGAAVAKAHPAQPQGKAQQKAKAAVSKEAQKKQKGSPQEKNAATKNQARKDEEKKAAKVAGVPVVPAQDSISLLNTAYQKLQEVTNNYGGHRPRAMRHIGAALGNLGSFEPLNVGAANGQLNRPVSDAKLREARTSLVKLKNQFDTKHGLAAGRGDARRAVDDAIREIDSALIVR